MQEHQNNNFFISNGIVYIIFIYKLLYWNIWIFILYGYKNNII